MTVIWGGSYRSRSASGSHPARVTAAAGIRRLAAALDGVALPPKARAVELSEHAATLNALAQLHKVAAEERGGGLSAPSPAALNKSFGAAGDAASWPEPPRGPDARNERRIR